MEKNDSYRNPFNGKGHGEFTWCLHCERVYRTRAWIERGWNCPGKDCDGGILDAHSWGPDSWPMDCNPDYPDVPIEGKLYPLYGKNCRVR